MDETAKTTCEEFYFRRIAPVEATIEDHRQFFDLLWRTHAECVFKHAYSRLRNFQDARDVCQDVFVRAMQFVQANPGRIPLKVNFGAWLRVIARNLINDRFRRVLVRPGRLDSHAAEQMPVEDPPESRLITAQDLELLRKCMQELTERARTIVRLCDLEELPQKDIAARLRSNPNAVCVALHRARKALRECVTKGWQEA